MERHAPGVAFVGGAADVEPELAGFGDQLRQVVAVEAESAGVHLEGHGPLFAGRNLDVVGAPEPRALPGPEDLGAPN